jgi:hypothetical protein
MLRVQRTRGTVTLLSDSAVAFKAGPKEKQNDSTTTPPIGIEPIAVLQLDILDLFSMSTQGIEGTTIMPIFGVTWRKSCALSVDTPW